MPGEMFCEASNPFPFPGTVSSVQRPLFDFVIEASFEVVLLGEVDGESRLGAILINMQRSWV